MNIKLLVLRTPDLERLATFYKNLGIVLDYHKHGNSPFHYSSDIDGTVLELYPLAKGQIEPDKHLRLGFSIDDFEATLVRLKEADTPIVMEATKTEYGLMAIVSDPDQRKVELYKNV